MARVKERQLSAKEESLGMDPITFEVLKNAFIRLPA